MTDWECPPLPHFLLNWPAGGKQWSDPTIQSPQGERERDGDSEPTLYEEARKTESYLKSWRHQKRETEKKGGSKPGKEHVFLLLSCPVSSPSQWGRCVGYALRYAHVCIHKCVTFVVFAPRMRVCVCSCALSLVRKKRPLIEFPLISRQPRLAERDACLPAAQRHTSGVVDNGGWHFCPTMPRGSMWYMASSMKVKLS